MLANVLKSERAVQVSIRIIELFVKLREMILTTYKLRSEKEKIKKRKTHNKDWVSVTKKIMCSVLINCYQTLLKSKEPYL